MNKFSSHNFPHSSLDEEHYVFPYETEHERMKRTHAYIMDLEKVSKCSSVYSGGSPHIQVSLLHAVRTGVFLFLEHFYFPGAFLYPPDYRYFCIRFLKIGPFAKKGSFSSRVYSDPLTIVYKYKRNSTPRPYV